MLAGFHWRVASTDVGYGPATTAALPHAPSHRCRMLQCLSIRVGAGSWDHVGTALDGFAGWAGGGSDTGGAGEGSLGYWGMHLAGCLHSLW